MGTKGAGYRRGTLRNRVVAACAAVCAMLAWTCLGPLAAAGATTITVNGEGDSLSAHAGVCLLRQAVLASIEQRAIGGCAAGTGTDTIDISVPKVTLSLVDSEENNSLFGDLDLKGQITIKGRSGGSTISAAGLGDRVIDVQPGATATLEDLTITGGELRPEVAGSDIPGESGGGIRNAGTLTLRDATVKGNASSPASSASPLQIHPGAQGGAGGGIFSSGTLTVIDSSILDNTAGDGSVGSPTTKYGQSYFSYGGSGGDGGGIASTGTTTVTGSVISGNRSGDGGPGGESIGTEGPAGSDDGFDEAGERVQAGWGGSGGLGGGVAVDGGTFTMTGSLVSGNTTGNGGAGGLAEGGDGASEPAGIAGSGGYAEAGSGGSGGSGGGVYVAYGAESATIASDTITGNTTGAGGAGGKAIGGTSGASGSPINGEFGNGGDAKGGNGGGDGWGAGAAGALASNAVFLADTIADNTASEAYVQGGEGFGGPPGSVQVAMGGGRAGTGLWGEIGPVGKGGGLAWTTVEDSIIAYNEPDQCDEMAVPIGVPALNVSYPQAGCNGLRADPLLEPLADNGGPTDTFALPADSPAVGEVLSAEPTACPATDQRGVARPQGAACDAGAYELQVASPATTPPPTTTTPTDTTPPPTDATPGPTGEASPPGTGTGTTPGGTPPVAEGNVPQDVTPPQAATPGETTPGISEPPEAGASSGPVLTRLSVRRASSHAATARHASELVISWSDSQAAKTTIRIERATSRHGRKRWSTLKGSLRHSDRAGANTLRWNGALAGRTLAPGSYRLRVRAKLDGRSSRVLALDFTIPR